uniref:Uncharacterized protein n=1 Tax=Glossina brevipalpis TaxID=37001 RepID=A0A1A9X3L1_9MUSC
MYTRINFNISAIKERPQKEISQTRNAGVFTMFYAEQFHKFNHEIIVQQSYRLVDIGYGAICRDIAAFLQRFTSKCIVPSEVVIIIARAIISTNNFYEKTTTTSPQSSPSSPSNTLIIHNVNKSIY